jgi:hypothetical protein
LAGRKWSVCIFCLFLKFTSLQIHAEPPWAFHKEASASTPSLISSPAKTNPDPQCKPRCQQARPALARQWELRNNLVFRKGGKKNNFKFQAPRAFYRWLLSGEGKTKLWRSPVAPLGRGEDIEVRGCCSLCVSSRAGDG